MQAAVGREKTPFRPFHTHRDTHEDPYNLMVATMMACCCFFLLFIASACALKCDSSFADPCAIKTSRLAVGRVVAAAQNVSLAQDLAELFSSITAGRYNLDGGFSVIVIQDEGSGLDVLVAHGTRQDVVGLTLHDWLGLDASSFSGDFFHTAMVNATQTHTLVNQSSCFLPTTAYTSEDSSFFGFRWSNPNATIIHYVQAVDILGTSYWILSGYSFKQLPYVVPCSAKQNAACAFQNIKSIVGLAHGLAYQVNTLAQREKFFYDVTYGSILKIPTGFYAFVYEIEGQTGRMAQIPLLWV